MRFRYLAKKVGWALVTMAFVLAFNFFLFRIMPGDPAGLLARSQRLTEAEVAEQRALFGLDEPLFSQFGTYLKQTLTGNLGTSYLTGQPVIETITSRMWPTVLSSRSRNDRRHRRWPDDGHPRGLDARIDLRPIQPLRVSHAVRHARGLARA